MCWQLTLYAGPYKIYSLLEQQGIAITYSQFDVISGQRSAATVQAKVIVRVQRWLLSVRHHGHQQTFSEGSARKHRMSVSWDM